MKSFYKPIKDYYARFGLRPEPETNDETARKRQEAALERAWKNRDFEIDKFWQRSAFFWGFIVVVFGAFAAVVTRTVKVSDSIHYLELYLILLGVIVSVAWLLIVKGSKFWQENWEAHIDYLENAVTGPLYKTVYTKGKDAFSVSKINIILAWVVIVMWGVLFINFFLHRGILQKFFEYILPFICQNAGILLPIVLTVVCIVVMLTHGRSASGKLQKKYSEGVFIERPVKGAL